MRPRDRHRRILTTCLLTGALLAGCADLTVPSDGAFPSATATSQVPAQTTAPFMGPVGADGCFDRVASGVAVRDVHVYQSVRITLVADGALVDRADRTADVVADKDAVIGVDIETAPDWVEREVAVRVAVVPTSGEPTLRSARLVPGGDARTDAASLGDVVVDLPREAITPEAGVVVTIVECTAVPDAGSSGTGQPAELAMDLAARRTGGIKVHLVPFQVAGFVPSTSESVLDGYRDALLAMYPVTDVDITVGDLVDGGDRPDLGSLLIEVGRIRDRDRPAEDVYYYGMATGAATREAYCDDCITGTSEDGGGVSLGFAIGAAFGDQRAEDTFLHELGHAHGLLHAPCGDADRANPDFPYPDGVIGVPGRDRRTGASVPASTHDFMGYCFPRWISDHHYQRLVDRVAAVNGHGTGP